MPAALLAIPFVMGAVEARSEHGLAPLFLGFLGVLALGVVAMFASYCLPLADSVDDAGDALVVRRHGVEERVSLANVMLVVKQPFGKYGARVALQLREPGRLGGDIHFAPPGAFFDPLVDRLVQELQDRARVARSETRKESDA
jgi:hypothetical protein